MKKFFEKVSSNRFTNSYGYENLQQLFGVSMYFAKKCNKKPDKNQVCRWHKWWPKGQMEGFGPFGSLG